jgi:F-type H+-transporting ATPase subunit alpha
VSKQAIILYAATNGHVDDYPVEALAKYEEELYHFMDNRYGELMKDLAEKNEITDDIKGKLEDALAKFKEEFVY